MVKQEEAGLEEARAERSLHDVWFGFGIAAAAATLIVWVIPASVASPASVEARPLDPRFLPYVTSALVGVLGIVCGLQSLLGPGVPKETGEGFVFRQQWATRMLALLTVFGAYLFLAQWIGMLPIAIGVTGLLVWLEGERNVWRGLSVAVLLPLGVYFFFVWVAQVPLPNGVLGWLG